MARLSRALGRSKHLVPVAALILGAAAGNPSQAQVSETGSAAVTDTVSLSLGEAVDRAVSRSQEVRLARSQVQLAAAQVRAVRSSALPQLDGNLGYTRTFESPFGGGGIDIPDSLRFEPDSTASLEERVSYLERRVPSAALGGIGALFGNLPFGRENAYVASLTGSQALYSGGRLSAASRIAKEFQEAARLGLLEQTAEIELQVRSAYFRARLGQELERSALAAADQAEQFLNQERLRFRAGTVSELEVLRADVSLENLRPQVIAARNAAELATLDLKRLVDIPLERPVRLTTPLVAPTPEQLALVSPDPHLLLAQRAAVAAAERQVAIREQQVRIARAAFLPSAGLRVNYGKQLFPSQPFDLGGQDWLTDFTATIAVQVPIFSGFRRQAELQQRRIELEQERLRLGQLREAIQLQYQQAEGEKQRAAASIAARTRTADQAQRVYELTLLRYDRGLATQLEVSEARLALLQARTNLAQAIADFYIAEAGLSRALGAPLGPGPGAPGTTPTDAPVPAALPAGVPATPPLPVPSSTPRASTVPQR